MGVPVCRAESSLPLSVHASLAAVLVCLLIAACAGGRDAPVHAVGRAPRLPATGRLAGGAAFRVTLQPTIVPVGSRPLLVPAWCPRVDLVYPGNHPTHGAVGCRQVRPHLPTGGYAIFCRLPEVFVLLVSSAATRSVSVVTASGRPVALTNYATDGLIGRFWLAHYPGDASPRLVASVEGTHPYLQRYSVVRCLATGNTNGLLGR
ncbi:MAG: hypothetical protein QOH12_359 [Solirubrobacteraceae bacterium]|nr:hypothetical protein [Solirubrobacteraceae bacterium]